jgi:hypothetical protein
LFSLPNFALKSPITILISLPFVFQETISLTVELVLTIFCSIVCRCISVNDVDFIYTAENDLLGFTKGLQWYWNSSPQHQNFSIGNMHIKRKVMVDKIHLNCRNIVFRVYEGPGYYISGPDTKISVQAICIP